MADGGMNIVQQNAQLRQILLASAMRMRKNIGTFTATALGATTRIKLFNVGIVTKLCLWVTCPVTIGTANATRSAKAPYNLINSVQLNDYNNTQRTILSGAQLYQINSVRKRQAAFVNNGGPIVDANGSAALGGEILNPSCPIAVGNVTISFYLEVPVAFDQETDLRGAILAQTAVGDMYLTINWNSTLYQNGSIEAVYNGAGTTTVVLNGVTGPSVTVFQEYLLPQAINIGGKSQLPIPVLDLQTVYELLGNIRTSDNIAVNSEKLINYPNVRSVIGMYWGLINGNTASATDLNLIRIIANGNNVVKEWNQQSLILENRDYTSGDLFSGAYNFILHRSKPIETALFGNFQLGLTPNTVNANAYVEFATESFYTLGAALPGVSQG